MVQFQAWLEVNKKPLLAGGVILLAVIAVAYTAKYLNRQNEAKANAALLALNLPISAAEEEDQPPASAADLLSVKERFSGTQAAERAHLLAAGRLFNEGKFSESRQQFEAFLKQYPSSPLNMAAHYGKAAGLEAEGKSAEALAAYESIVNLYPKSYVAPQARIAIGRLKEAQGEFEAAHAIYKQITESTNMTSWASVARQRRSSLEKEHPDLVKVEAATPRQSNTVTNMFRSSATISGDPSGSQPIPVNTLPAQSPESTQDSAEPKPAEQPEDSEESKEPQPEEEAPETEQPETEQPETEQPETEQPETPAEGESSEPADDPQP